MLQDIQTNSGADPDIGRGGVPKDKNLKNQKNRINAEICYRESKISKRKPRFG